MERLLYLMKKIIPRPVFTFFQPYYHRLLAYAAAVRYGHPSRELTIIGVTGTKGKSSTTELLARILREDGKQVASLSTIQFQIGDEPRRNLYKMTMPGRFFVQKFLRDAADASCTHVVLEMTSEGVRQFRHKHIELDGLVFTNLTPEHIESHGSFANYKQAKLKLAQAVARSSKRPRMLVSNVDDEHGADFLDFKVEQIRPYSLSDLTLHSLQKESVSLVFGDMTIRVPLVGKFNVYNCLAAITAAQTLGVSLATCRTALEHTAPLAGRVEHFTTPDGVAKKVTAVVDYAHTPDSLKQLYEAFPDKHKVCVLGNTGGGRDTWKRPEMGAIAQKHCNHIILTNEDPYDEDPKKIVTDMKNGMSAEASVEIIMDRRQAIKTALDKSPTDGYVLISGKGTDPYIMGPHGSRQEWSDATVVQELLAELPHTPTSPGPSPN